MNGSPSVDLDELRQVLLLALDVDVRIARVAEDAEEPVDAHVEARRLHQGGVVGVDRDPARGDQARDRSVGENHGAILPAGNSARPGGRECGTLGDPVSMLYGPMDPNERFRARRDQTRRTKRRRRAAVLAFLLLAVIAVVMGARFVSDNQSRSSRPAVKPASRPTAPVNGRRRQPQAASGRDPRRPRHGCARVAARQVPGVRRLQALRAQHDRARRQGRGWRDRVRARGRPAGAHGRSDASVLQPEGPRRAGPPERHLHDRPRRLLPGSEARAGTAGSRDPAPRRQRLDDERRHRLGQPVRPPRLGLLRLGRRGGRQGRLRPDHVRLRPVPVRRRRRRRRLPGQDERLAGPRDRRLRRLREEAARTERDARLDGRSSGSPRRETSGSARCRAGSRSPSTASRRCRIPCSTAMASSASRARVAQPGETVFRTLTDFRRQMKGSRAQLVPLGAGLGLHAAAGAGPDRRGAAPGRKGYLLWNASGLYTKAALAPASAKLEG